MRSQLMYLREINGALRQVRANTKDLNRQAQEVIYRYKIFFT